MELHARHLRAFVEVWRLAKARELRLPRTEDPDYATLEALLVHVIACARGYMVWICEKLELPEPGIRPAPQRERIEAELDEYVEHLLERWRLPLREVPEERFNDCFPSRWGVLFCADSMLEHAVLHPIRHSFQLTELMGGGE